MENPTPSEKHPSPEPYVTDNAKDAHLILVCVLCIYFSILKAYWNCISLLRCYEGVFMSVHGK